MYVNIVTSNVFNLNKHFFFSFSFSWQSPDSQLKFEIYHEKS